MGVGKYYKMYKTYVDRDKKHIEKCLRDYQNANDYLVIFNCYLNDTIECDGSKHRFGSFTGFLVSVVSGSRLVVEESGGIVYLGLKMSDLLIKHENSWKAFSGQGDYYRKSNALMVLRSGLRKKYEDAFEYIDLTGFPVKGSNEFENGSPFYKAFMKWEESAASGRRYEIIEYECSIPHRGLREDVVPVISYDFEEMKCRFVDESGKQVRDFYVNSRGLGNHKFRIFDASLRVASKF